MFNRMIEKACQREAFFREDTLTERCILSVFLYQIGLSYRRIEPFVDRSHEAIRNRFYINLSCILFAIIYKTLLTNIGSKCQQK